jgi:hypothetical protein
VVNPILFAYSIRIAADCDCACDRAGFSLVVWTPVTPVTNSTGFKQLKSLMRVQPAAASLCERFFLKNYQNF